MPTLTPKQKQILDYIENYIKKNGISPTFEEIGHRANKAFSTVHEHVETLIRKGFLVKTNYSSRGIELKKRSVMVKIPLLGVIAAGQPIEALQEKETIAVPQEKLPRSGNFYALRVQGDSMMDEGIHDKDTILVKKQNFAENGDKVVALLNGNEATLKTFYKEKGCVRLQPANKNYRPVIITSTQEFALQGVLFDVIRTNEPLPLTPTFVLPSIKIPKQPLQNNLRPYFKNKDGNFVLYLGNCLVVMSQLPACSIDMVFADPPYNLSNNGFSLHAGKRVSVNKGNWDKSKGFKDDYDFHYRWLNACKRILKPGGTLWVSGTYHSIYQCGHALQSLDYHIMNDIAWFKPNGSPNLSCRYFTASHETLIWARKDKKTKHFFNYKLMKNGGWPEDFIKKPNLQMRSVWAIYPPKKIEKVFGKHPTQKPVELLKRIILASTQPGATILDPFTGSSTTGIASAIIGKRKFIGIDINQNFLDLSIKRFEEIRSGAGKGYHESYLRSGNADSSTSV